MNTPNANTPEPVAAPGINLHATLARTTLGVGLCASALGMIARQEQTALGSVGGFIGALAILLVMGPVAERHMGRVIDHTAKMNDERWKNFSNTRIGKVMSRVSTGKLASLLTSVPIFVAGVYAADPLVTQGPTPENIGLAMAGAGFWVAANTVMGKLRKVQQQLDGGEGTQKPKSPRMR
jgi:hypothetical protein